MDRTAPTRMAAALLTTCLLAGCTAAAGEDETAGAGSTAVGPGGGLLTKTQKVKLDEALDVDRRYTASYKNMVLAGQSDGKPFVFIAGTHSPDFPFFGDRPWDNGLLLVGDRGYHFTHRTQGKALALDLDVDEESGRAHIRYDGEMKRASDGEAVHIEIDLPARFDRHAALQLGKPYAIFDSQIARKLPGMRWQPFELEADRGRVETGDGLSAAVSDVDGELEHGILTGVRSPRFAFTYDYVSLAQPGEDGYTFIDYTANPVDDSGAVGSALASIMGIFASATVTLDDGRQLHDTHGVRRPPQDDESVVLFDNTVELELAVLERQLIRTRDRSGEPLYGLREIFVPRSQPPADGAAAGDGDGGEEDPAAAPAAHPWRLAIESATVHPRKPNGRAWDAGGDLLEEGRPDPFATIGVGDDELRTYVQGNTLEPAWGEVVIPRADPNRLDPLAVELIDDDALENDRIGTCRDFAIDERRFESGEPFTATKDCPRDENARAPQAGFSVTFRLEPATASR